MMKAVAESAAINEILTLMIDEHERIFTNADPVCSKKTVNVLVQFNAILWEQASKGKLGAARVIAKSTNLEYAQFVIFVPVSFRISLVMCVCVCVCVGKASWRCSVATSCLCCVRWRRPRPRAFASLPLPLPFLSPPLCTHIYVFNHRHTKLFPC
jgi:hypothetical protein